MISSTSFLHPCPRKTWFFFRTLFCLQSFQIELAHFPEVLLASFKPLAVNSRLLLYNLIPHLFPFEMCLHGFTILCHLLSSESPLTLFEDWGYDSQLSSSLHYYHCPPPETFSFSNLALVSWLHLSIHDINMLKSLLILRKTLHPTQWFPL